MKTPSKSVQKDIRDLLASQKLAVLSTQDKGQPYASLVAFAATDDLKNMFFVTPKTTRKFAYLSANPQVAVLVNSSMNQEADFHHAISVTAVCRAREATAAEKEKFLNLYLSKHPYLEDFAKSPSCAFIALAIKSFYMVKNFQQVFELHITK